MNKMLIEVLDGKNCIGGSKILITEKDSSFFLDFGKNFSKFGEYFEEFLSPRTGTGIFDLWKLNLIPKINNIYREDLLPPYLNEKTREINLNAIFLSHAHLDHAGLISILKEDIPIIATSTSIKFLNVIETIKSTTLNEFTKIKKRSWEKDEDFDEIVSKSMSKKKKTLDVNNEEDDSNIKERSFIKIEMELEERKLENLKFYTYRTDHSIFGSLGFFIEIGGKGIGYTGDIRFHGKNNKSSYKFVEELKKKKPDILITEGTRKKDERLNRKEDEVFIASVEVTKTYNGKLIIADFGPRNIERLETFLKIAKETGRKILITFKDALLLDLLKDETNIIDDNDVNIIHEKKLDSSIYIKYIKDKYKNKIITPKILNENQGDFIICYSFFDLVNLLDLEIKKGAYIYSTSEAYTEEQEFDIKRLFNWIKFFNLDIFGIEIEKDKFKFTGNYHSSGHASFDDIIWMINEINPKYIIPVHTENIDEFVRIFGDKRVIKEDFFEL